MNTERTPQQPEATKLARFMQFARQLVHRDMSTGEGLADRSAAHLRVERVMQKRGGRGFLVLRSSEMGLPGRSSAPGHEPQAARRPPQNL